jgi:hypothetical protein
MSDLDFLEFNLAGCRDWPELHTLASALGAFAERAGRETEMLQVDFERAVARLARSLLASDCCTHCEDLGDAYAPYTVRRNGDGIRADYRCEQGHVWSCWWGPREAVAELG